MRCCWRIYWLGRRWPALDRANALPKSRPAGLIARLGSDALRHPSPIHALAFSPDGKLLACGGEGSIGLFDAETGEPRGEFAAHEGNVVALAFAPSGEQLASAGVDGTVRLWNLTSKPTDSASGTRLRRRRPGVELPLDRGPVVLSHRTGRVCVSRPTENRSS